MSSEKEWKQVEGILVPIKYVSGVPSPLLEQNIADFISRRPSARSMTIEAVIGYCSLEKWKRLECEFVYPFGTFLNQMWKFLPWAFYELISRVVLTDITVSFSAPDVRQRHKEICWNDDRVVRHFVRILERFVNHSLNSLYLYTYLWFI
jgi:hypothetical protein